MNITDNNKHLFYMDRALEEAKKALELKEVPIGAIIVDESGNVIAKTHNKVETLGCQTGHAEVLAIEEACKKRGDWRLDGCSIYVTLEPCAMCFGLINLSRVKALYYGARSPLFGCDIDNKEHFPLYQKSLIVKGNIRDEVSIKLLRQFFGDLRRRESRKWKIEIAS